MFTAVVRHEVLSLRRGVYSVALDDGGRHLVAGHRAESFPELSGPETKMLERLARESVAVEGRWGIDTGRGAVGSENDAESFVRRLWAGAWLNLGVATHDDGVQYVVEPLMPPPPRGEPPHDVMLSRFALLRRDGDAMVIESPRAWCDVRLLDPAAAGVVAGLATRSAERPAAPGELGRALLADLWWSGILVDADGEERTELPYRQWKPHELWFHERSRGGHRAYAGGGFGGTGWARGEFEPLPARHEPRFPGPRMALARPDLAVLKKSDPSLTEVLESRTSIRQHDDGDPLTFDELGQFLYRCARTREIAPYEGVEYKSKPYPSGGSTYELEIYPLVRNVAGLSPGMYHYDADDHELVLVAADDPTTRRLLRRAQMSARPKPGPPQVVLVISARFGRIMWKYEAMSYALILKHVGVLYQTMYAVATAMGLAPCGLGSGDSVLFAEITGLDPVVEGGVGEFMLGRPRAGTTTGEPR